MPARDNTDDNLVVQFKYLAVPNDEKSLEAGRPIFDDLEVCEIRQPGSKDVKVFPSTQMSADGWVQDPITGTQTQRSYAERFQRQYQQFKARAAQTVTGTPLEFAQFLTEGRRAELRALNVYTIEMLAAIDGQELKNIGMGGRELKNKAAKFLEDAKSGAADRQLRQEIEVLRARNQVLEEDNKALAERAKQTVATGGAFDDMTDAQLIDYITEHAGRAPHGNLPRKTLLRMAAEATPNKAA